MAVCKYLPDILYVQKMIQESVADPGGGIGAMAPPLALTTNQKLSLKWQF